MINPLPNPSTTPIIEVLVCTVVVATIEVDADVTLIVYVSTYVVSVDVVYKVSQ